MSVDVVVVGAGLAGLRCALALADSGLRVTVLEATAHAGGRAGSWADEQTGLQIDTGPQAVCSEDRNLRAMLQRLGMDGQLQWQGSPWVTLHDARGVVLLPACGLPPPLHGLVLLPKALSRLPLRDLLSQRQVAWHAARANEAQLRELDTDDAAGWLRAQGVRPPAIDWFWRSMVLALLHVPLEHCSAAAALRVFRLLLGRSGWQFGYPKIGLAQLYVPGCCRAVLRSGGQVLFGARVQRLRLEQGRLAGVEMQDGHVLAAPRCVLAVPPQELGPLLGADPRLEPLANAARYFRPSPSHGCYVWFDRPVTAHRCWVRAWDPGGLNTGFHDLSNIRPGLAGKGAVIACSAVGPQVRSDWSDDRIIEHTMREIEQFAPAARQARVLHTRVQRLPMTVPQPRLGTEMLRPGSATAVPGLWIAGDWTDTALPFSLESAARSGALAAEAVLASLGRTARIAFAAAAPSGWMQRLQRG